jgi:hypothetical protein
MKRYKITKIILSLVILGISLTKISYSNAQTSCELKPKGDANCDAKIDLLDFNIFRSEFILAQAGTLDITESKANFNNDQNVDLLDFQIFRKGFIEQPTITPTSSQTPVPSTSPTSTATVIPTQSPTPLVTITPITAKKGIWISQEEIVKLPMTGTAWTNMKATADSNIGTANLADQNSSHDQKTLAVALVAARTGDAAMRTKAVNSILSVIGTDANPDPDCDTSPSMARSLAVARNLSSYVTAADIINLRSGTDGTNGKKWQDYVEFIRFKKNCRNNGGNPSRNLSEIHDFGSSNGDVLGGGSRIAAAAYLGDKAELDKAWATYQFYAGDRTKCSHCATNLNAAGESWSYTADASKQVAVNPIGTTKNGHKVDGAIVNDQGRGGSFAWPPGYTQYPWEGLQGFYLQAEILTRMGYPAYDVMDKAPLRALDYQYYLSQEFGSTWWNNEPWVVWVANKAYGKTYTTKETAGGGKNMSWTDWTHQKL